MRLLLYAKTDEDIVPDNDYIIGGNRISVKTLDLNTDFSNISKQLNAIVENFYHVFYHIKDNKQKLYIYPVSSTPIKNSRYLIY